MIMNMTDGKTVENIVVGMLNGKTIIQENKDSNKSIKMLNNSIKIYNNILEYIGTENKIIKSYKPKVKGVSEPKADVIVETENKKFRISIKLEENSYLVTLGAKQRFIDFIKSQTSNNDIIKHAEKISTYLNVISKYNRNEKSANNFLKYVDKSEKRILSQNIDINEVKKELLERFKKGNDYNTVMKHNQKAVKEFFMMLKNDYTEVYENVFLEAMTASSQFGIYSDATAEFKVDKNKMYKIDLNYVKSFISKYAKSHKKFRLQGVPRHVVRLNMLEQSIQCDKINTICEELVRMDMSIKF